MPGVQFYKYSAYGNTFVVLDEVDGAELPDEEKSRFAPIATDQHGGIGADNLLVVQRYSPALLDSIQAVRGYWSSDVASAHASAPPEYVFRMFEPDGSEALCCGNGLLCIAKHMSRIHGVERCTILTEVPSAAPRVREIAARAGDPLFQHEVRIGPARALPEALMTEPALSLCGGSTGSVGPLVLHGVGASGGEGLPLQGYVTYTGEPHMVVLDHEPMPEPLAAAYRAIMGDSPGARGSTKELPSTPASRVDGRLLDELGLALNDQARGLFPRGINLSFARMVPGADVVEYRCFERGIFKETLACGTAAVAVASILRELGRTESRELTFWPKRSRDNSFYSNASIQVAQDDAGDYWLRGQAKRVYDATLRTSEYPGVRAAGRRSS
jgi:diaminopimelate epimerase